MKDLVVLEKAKKYQKIFKFNLNEIVKGRHKSKEKESALKILKYFTKNNKLLINYLMIILQLHLRLNITQFMEKRCLSYLSTCLITLNSKQML